MGRGAANTPNEGGLEHTSEVFALFDPPLLPDWGSPAAN